MKTLFHLVLYTIVVTELSWTEQVSSSPCQVYPSEYAYHHDSISRLEGASANCRRYPAVEGDMGLIYIHCDGMQLELTDSNLGQEQYRNIDYYEWAAGRDGQLLFILPTRVSLTTITLHYYSDSDRGLPRLRFYAVLDDFDVWDAPTIGISHVDATAVPPGGEPAGRRNVSINVNFNTTKVLMYKFSSTFQFAVSEVDFFICIKTINITPNLTTIASISLTKESNYITTITDDRGTIQESEILESTSTKSSKNSGDSRLITIIASGVAGILLLLLIITLIAALSLLLCYRKRRTCKLKIDSNTMEDVSYSTLDRGKKELTQLQDDTELYDEIHLSPSTGQTELISKADVESEKEISAPKPNIYSSVDVENSQPISNSEIEMTKSEDQTYAVVDKKKKKKYREASHNSSNSNASDPTDAVHFNATEKKKYQDNEQAQQFLEDMYTIVYKKPKKCKEQEEIAPPVPSHTMESLYSAIQKKSH